MHKKQHAGAERKYLHITIELSGAGTMPEKYAGLSGVCLILLLCDIFGDY